MSHDRMQRLAREWDFVQRERIALGNMEKSYTRMGIPDRTDLAGRVGFLEKQEEAILNELRLQARSKKEEAEAWLREVYAFTRDTLGLGDSLLCVVGLLPALPRFPNPAKLWRYCGLDVVEGKSRRAVAGQKLGFSKRLRSYCIMRLVDPVIKCRESTYRSVYDARRAHTDLTHPEWSTENPKAPDMHSHRDAMRVTAKRILLDVWRASRDHGLTVTPDKPVASDPERSDQTRMLAGSADAATAHVTPKGSVPHRSRPSPGRTDHDLAVPHHTLVGAPSSRARRSHLKRDPHASPAAPTTTVEATNARA